MANLAAAYRRLQGVEARLEAGASVVNLAAVASAEAKLLLAIQCHLDGIDTEDEDNQDDREWLESDPLARQFFEAVEECGKRLETTDQ